MKENKKNLSDLIFKILLVFTVLFFVFVLIKSPFANFSIKENSLRTKKEKPVEKPIPGPLKWQDSFKGVSNNPQKKEKEMKFFK